MPDITFDIATKIIEPGQAIWSIFPGAAKKFFDLFVSERAIFLDTPGMNLPLRALSNDELLRQHVAMTNAIVRWYRSGSQGSPPSRRAGAYSVRKSHSDSAAVGNVRNVFVRMQPRDLVLVGGRTIYDPVLIGEIIRPFDPVDTVTYARYPRERIPVRRVRWLHVRQERRFLSEELSHLLSNRKAVISIDKKRFGDEVFKLAYGDFVFGHDARYVFEGPQYNNIATSTVPAINLISYFAAAFNAADIGEIDKFSRLDISDAINAYFEGDVLHSFEINFSSPGNFVLYAKRAALPLCVAVLVSATSGTMSYPQAAAAEVVNSSNPGAPGAVPGAAVVPDANQEVKQKYHSIMQSLGQDRYEELKQRNKDARDGVGLKVKVKQK